MRLVSRIVRPVLEPVLAATNWDVRSARWRLDGLKARHAEVSAIFSADDSPGGPSDRLLDLAPRLIARARHASLPLLSERGCPSYVHVWPGEAYRLLAALVEELRPRRIVEIGTYLGAGALAMLSRLPADARLTTIDILSWVQLSETYLRPTDFSDGRLVQLVFDPGQPSAAKERAEVFREADMIYLDAAKDGVLEEKLLENFAAIGLRPGTLLVFDDIRVWNMLGIWRAIVHPKLDLTSFGHWTGTGLVDWQGKIAP